MKKIKLALMILIPLLILIALGASVMNGQKAAQAKQKEDLLKSNVVQVTQGDVSIKVVETGSLEALTTVEVKSQVGGRVAKLLVDEGDYVQKGDLIAVIDPQQTELQVEQNRAQLDGAVSSVRRLDVEIAQRRVTVQTSLQRARLRVKQLEAELKAQPQLTNANVRSAETGLANAQKALEVLSKVTHPNARTQGENAKEDAENNLRNATIENDRQKGLFEKGYVSKREVEQSQLNLELAQTRARQAREALQRLDNEQRLEREQQQERVKQAKADLDRAKANSIVDVTKRQDYETALQNVRDAEVALRDVDSLLEQKRGSQANVSQIQSSLDDSMRLLGETEVRAPITGIVTRRFVQQGELVNALSSFSAGSPIVKVEDRSKMFVRLQINEIDVARLEEDMDSKITVDALPGTDFSGRVTKISPAQIENAAGVGGDPVVKYEVEVTLDRVSDSLKSGMSAKCEMTPQKATNVLRVPLAYLGEDGKGAFVMLFDPNEKPKPGVMGAPPTLEGDKQYIEIGVRDLAFIEVTKGLKVGQKLVRPPFNGPERQGVMQFNDGDEEEEAPAEGEESSGQAAE
ncbi:hypothetical protein C0431_07440 [bacterium]|jgi:HlyD family secretion protein|nr:hypothetical protein [bacterium]